MGLVLRRRLPGHRCARNARSARRRTAAPVPPGRRPAGRRAGHPGRRRAPAAHGRLVLAEGEATGHAHAIAEPDAREFRVGDERFVLVRSAAQLIHEEHATIDIPPGAYRDRHPARVRARADPGRTPGAGWSTDVEHSSTCPAKPADEDETSRAARRLPRVVASEPDLDRAGGPSGGRGGHRRASTGTSAVERPTIVWVASPLVGALAYQSIGTGHRPLTSPYAKGDVGTGGRRDFHGLRDPFGFPTYVEPAAPERLRQRCPGRQSSRPVDRTRDAARRTSATIRAELQRRIPLAIGQHGQSIRTPVAVDERLGELLVGSSAEPFARLVGPEVFSIVAGMAVRDGVRRRS